MQIGQEILHIGNPHKGTLHLLEETSLLGGVRNKRWLLYLVLRQNLEKWPKACVNFFG